MEVDRVAESLAVTEALSCSFDRLDLRIDPYSPGVRDPIDERVGDAEEILSYYARYALDRL